jgi:pimeloyl-ACP methyl ester carboxylesterase
MVALLDQNPALVRFKLTDCHRRKERRVESRSVEVNGISMRWEQQGEGRPVVFVHGTPTSPRLWRHVVPQVQNARSMAWEMVGYGASIEQGEGRDIQHIALFGQDRVPKLALVNSVLYDSWPVPRVARFRDPEVARSVSPEQLVELRREALRGAVERGLSPAEEEDYLSPWRSEDATRSWMALAAAADSRYTMELVEPLQRSGLPILLVWGEEDSAQPIGYARRFAREFPQARLVAVPGAGHIPMEDDPEMVGATLAGFFAEE